ncbi:MAG: Ppx/GppA phosphatase family protein [Bacillota bacterium]
MRIAAIDVGTNSTRLLIIDYKNEKFKVLKRELITTRLGEGVDQNHILTNKAIKRGLDALKYFDELITKYEVVETRVVGTSALRDVKNSQDFLDKIEKNLSFNLEIISGKKEAKYIYQGVRSDFKEKDFLTLDIGGGSTEFIWQKNNNIIEESLDIGAVRLTERNVLNPESSLTNSEYSAIKKDILKVIKNSKINDIISSKIVGVGGTITTLGAMDLKLSEYQSEKIHLYSLQKVNVDKLLNKLINSTLKERKKMNGLNPKRADIIIAGAIILKVIMDEFNFSEIIISERDILFGLINEVIKKNKKRM